MYRTNKQNHDMNNAQFIKGSELIEAIDNEIAVKVLQNIILERGLQNLPDYLSFQFSSFKQALVCAFKFEDSTEGAEYWNNVVNLHIK